MKHERETVILKWVLDGKEIRSESMERVVYRPKRGKPYIMSLGERKDLHSDNPPVVKFTATTVKPQFITDPVQQRLAASNSTFAHIFAGSAGIASD